LPFDYLAEARGLATRRGLGFHLDGARLYNAAVAYGRPAREVAAPFDSVSVCLSKGLGAPVGSVLLGDAALIGRARRWRKVAGGGWRQAGMLAAAAMHALDHHVERLAEDHARAARLAEGLGRIDGLAVKECHTNMVFVDVPAARLQDLAAHMAARGVKLSIGYLPSIRLVTHLDVDDTAIERTIDAFATFAY
jgi:threonine aldolase